MTTLSWWQYKIPSTQMQHVPINPYFPLPAIIRWRKHKKKVFVGQCFLVRYDLSLLSFKDENDGKNLFEDDLRGAFQTFPLNASASRNVCNKFWTLTKSNCHTEVIEWCNKFRQRWPFKTCSCCSMDMQSKNVRGKSSFQSSLEETKIILFFITKMPQYTNTLNRSRASSKKHRPEKITNGIILLHSNFHLHI